MGSPYQNMFNFDFTGGDGNALDNYVELTAEQKRKKQEEENFRNLPWSMRYDKELGDVIMGSEDAPTAVGRAVHGVENIFGAINKGRDIATSAIAGVPEQPYRKTLEGALPIEDIARAISPSSREVTFDSLNDVNSPTPEELTVPETISKPASELFYKGIEASSDPSQLLPIGALGPVGALATAPIFAPKMISEGARQIGQGSSEALRENDPAEGNRLIAGGIADLGMGSLMIKHPMERAGSVIGERFPSLNEPVSLAGTPSSQRGAIGPDISKVNSFEDSQYRKYGPEWKRLQTPEENAYHTNLTKGTLPPIDPLERAMTGIDDPETVQRVNELIDEGHSPERAARIAKAEKAEIPEEHLTLEDVAAIMEKEHPKNLPEEVAPITPVESQPMEATPIDEGINVEPLPGTDEPMIAEPIRRGRPLIQKQVIPPSESIPPVAPEPMPKMGPEAITDKDTLKQAWAKLSPAQRTGEIFGIFKSLRASGDLGQILRQGKMLTLDMLFNDPSALKESLKTMKNQTFSEAEFKDMQAMYEKDPTIKKYQEEFGLDIPGVGKHLKEEAFHGSLAEKLPIIGKKWIAPSDRAYTSYLNAARVWKMNNIVDKLTEAGLDINNPAHADAFKNAAKAVNILSSRGDFKSIGPALNKLSNFLWSPRNRASKFQLLHEYAKARTGLGEQMHPVVARELTRGLERVTAVNATLLALAAGTGAATVETDPRHTDFARFRFGNTVIDPWFGLQPIIRGIARGTTGASISTAGRETKTNMGTELGRYLASGAAPGVNLVWEQATGKDLSGFEKDRLTSLATSITPMIAENIYQQLSTNGLVGAAATAPLEMLGEAVDIRNPKQKKASSSLQPSINKGKKKGRYAF